MLPNWSKTEWREMSEYLSKLPTKKLTDEQKYFKALIKAKESGNLYQNDQEQQLH
jgi:hypothetical protein